MQLIIMLSATLSAIWLVKIEVVGVFKYVMHDMKHIQCSRLTISSSGKNYAPPIFGSLRSLYQKLALLRFFAVQGVSASRKLDASGRVKVPVG